MSSNSQFRQLAKRVEHLESALGQGDSSKNVRKQRELDAITETFRQAKQASKNMLTDDSATPEQLEAAIPFLDNIGHKEFARMEAERKRSEALMQEQMSRPIIQDRRLIENMQSSVADGSYYAWRESLKRQQPVEAVPAAPQLTAKAQKPGVSANAMRTAQKYAESQYSANQQKMQPYRAPLNGRKDESGILFPDPLNGVVA